MVNGNKENKDNEFKFEAVGNISFDMTLGIDMIWAQLVIVIASDSSSNERARTTYVIAERYDVYHYWLNAKSLAAISFSSTLRTLPVTVRG